jgi:hypothetical protein
VFDKLEALREKQERVHTALKLLFADLREGPPVESLGLATWHPAKATEFKVECQHKRRADRLVSSARSTGSACASSPRASRRRSGIREHPSS